MCGGNKMRAHALALCAAVALPAGQTWAFGGSFETSPAPAQPPANSAAPAEDGFGGSFGGTQSAPSGDASTGPFTGGSFDDVDPAPPQDSAQPEPPVQERPQIPDAIYQIEATDFGVQPTDRLRQNEMHAPTPLGIPGGAMVSTQGLIDALIDGMDIVMIDVLGSDYTIPGAYMAPELASPGHVNDALQQQAAIWLRQITDGNRDMPIVIYCSDPHCWLSYNASLRTIAAGYRAVYWYRGGLYAWEMAGLPLEPAPF